MDSQAPAVIATPEGIQHWMMCSAIARLKIEVQTGMSMSKGSTLAACRRLYGIKSRTKKNALAEMMKIYKEAYGRDYGSNQPFRLPGDASDSAASVHP